MDEVRPIDVNALLQRIRPVSWKDAMNAMLIGDVKILFAKMIEEAPTIEIALTSANGQWIEISRIEHDYETEIEEKCSICGRHVYRYDTQPQDNFCPTCGIHMTKY